MLKHMLNNNLKTKEFDELCLAFSLLVSLEEVQLFLSDICTIKELKTLTERLRVAKGIKNGETYRALAKSVPSSSATITRIAKWMKEGSKGYELVLNKLSQYSQDHSLSGNKL